MQKVVNIGVKKETPKKFTLCFQVPYSVIQKYSLELTSLFYMSGLWSQYQKMYHGNIMLIDGQLKDAKRSKGS